MLLLFASLYRQQTQNAAGSVVHIWPRVGAIQKLEELRYHNDDNALAAILAALEAVNED